MSDHVTPEFLSQIDWALETIFILVTNLGHEAHMDNADIARIIDEKDADTLEIISDTADEVMAKVQAIVVEERLKIAALRGVSGK